MTNRDLVQKAMPLFSLSKKEWSIFLKHLEDVERSEGEKSQPFKVLQKIQTNQARIEVMGNYNDYYSDILDELVRDCSCELQAV